MSHSDPLSDRRRQARHPNFTPLQLNSLLQQVEARHDDLFGKMLSKEEKNDVWEQIADRVNELDPKGFQRSGSQAKRKYIKYTSEQRLKEQHSEQKDGADQIPDSNHNEEEAETVTLSEENVSFVDVMGMIPDASQQSVDAEIRQEQLCLQKIHLFMKMKKYHKQGFLTPTDVRLVTRWIKNPATLPFRTTCKK